MVKKKISFEEAMDSLEEIIYKLEEGNASLEESIELYKKGSEYAELCRKKLMDAEGKILILRNKYESAENEEKAELENFDDNKD